MTAERPDKSPVHAGVLVPWANTVVEAELHRVTEPSVIWHYARLVPASRTTGLDAQFLRGLLEAAPAALAQLSALPLRYAYLACTSAAFMYPDSIEQVRQGAPVTVVNAFEAIMNALSQRAASRIVLLTPYPDEITKAEALMFSRNGVAVTGYACLGFDDGYDTITGEHVRELILKAGCAAMDEAEAIVLSCTGWPTLDLIPDIQQNLGKPVISSNLAIGWHAQQAKET
ncbi:MAG: aspartate/glutamate racemase family protein [Streptosporangiaceae bacterium]|nr:aspartate/glutamate racemase family protein [Streptosporangiaceae bacterium]